MTNTNKTRAIASGIAAGISGFISFIANTPPEQQAGLLAEFVELLPVDWRPGVAFFTKVLSAFTLYYSVHCAALSGPQTPPKNPPSA